MDDLKTLLRRGHEPFDLEWTAADAIERLEAEIERLRAALGQKQCEIDHLKAALRLPKERLGQSGDQE